MKRLMVLIILLTGTVFIFAQTPAANATASIREMAGTVELKTPGSTNWKPAKAGDTLVKETIISTGFKSSAILVVGNSTLTVRPLTRLSLEALLRSQDNSETINVGLRTGRIQVDVKPPAGSRTDFTVTTPVATASVRGTSFNMNPVTIQVTEGAVVYKPAGQAASARPVMVSIGQSSQVDTDSGKAANPQALAEAKRSLPALPGKASSSSSDNVRIIIPQGYAAISAEMYWEGP